MASIESQESPFLDHQENPWSAEITPNYTHRTFTPMNLRIERELMQAAGLTEIGIALLEALKDRFDTGQVDDFSTEEHKRLIFLRGLYKTRRVGG